MLVQNNITVNIRAFLCYPAGLQNMHVNWLRPAAEKQISEMQFILAPGFSLSLFRSTQK